MSKYRNYDKDSRDIRTVKKFLERAYNALHQLTLKHYDLMDRKEEPVVSAAEDNLLALIKRIDPDFPKSREVK